MSDSHLLNTLKFIHKSAVSYVESLNEETILHELTMNMSFLNGEMAIDSLESEYNCILENGINHKEYYESFLNQNSFNSYKQEAINRGLKIQIEHPYYDDEDRLITYLINLK